MATTLLGYAAVEGSDTDDAQPANPTLARAFSLPPADAALLERLRYGDTAAFAELIDCHHGALIRVAMAFVADRSAAEEVVQDTWIAVITGIGSFEGRSSVKTWLFRILTNRAKTRGVRDARCVSFSALVEDGEEPALVAERFDDRGKWASPPRPFGEDTPEKLVLQHEALRYVQTAVASLPPAQRAVLTLRDIEGLDSDEVCDILDISETNQRVLLHRARAKVRCALEQGLGSD